MADDTKDLMMMRLKTLLTAALVLTLSGALAMAQPATHGTTSPSLDLAPAGEVMAAAPAHAQAHAEHAAGEHEQPPLLSADPGAAIWTLILFVSLLIVLGKFVWPPILKGLQAREGKIRSDISAAEAANAAAQRTLAEYQQKVAEAHLDARKLIEQARKDGETLRAQMAGTTEAEIQKLRKRAAEEINQAKNQAVQELYAKASELSVAVAEKILNRQITEHDTAKLIDQSLAELDRLKVG